MMATPYSRHDNATRVTHHHQLRLARGPVTQCTVLRKGQEMYGDGAMYGVTFMEHTGQDTELVRHKPRCCVHLIKVTEI